MACLEDSRQLNTSYIERLNLTIRQGSAYLVGASVMREEKNGWMIIWNCCDAITTSSDHIVL